MKAKEREIRRKKRILDHAVESGNVAKTSSPLACRYNLSIVDSWRHDYVAQNCHRLSCSLSAWQLGIQQE